tara:strand:- start:230 stop:1273 length:1044 start_codon:yes stop_codon:yes gene_type:complete
MVDFANRYVAIQREDFGSYGSVASNAGTKVYGEVDEESIGHKFDLMVREDMSRHTASKAVTGKEYSDGDISLAMQVDDFVGNLLYGFFPKDTKTGSGDNMVHVLEEPTGTDDYPSFTLEIGREEKEHTFTGMCANTLNVSATVGEYVMMSVGFYGKGESAVSTLVANPAFSGDALDALHFANGTVSFAGGSATATIKSFSFDINLNQDPDNAYALGGAGPQRRIPKQRREVSGTIEFNQVLYTADAGSPTYSTLIAADGDSDNPADATPAITLLLKDEALDDLIKFEFGKVFFEAPEASVSGRDTNTMTVNFRGLYDAADVGGGGTPSDYACKVTMTGPLQNTAYSA